MKPAGIAVRLAVRLALGAHPGQRLRLVLLGGVAVMVALLSLFTVGTVQALDGERGRFEARSVRLATPGRTAALSVDLRTDTWRQEQYPVIWLDPLDERDSAALPPGMESWPAPGDWYVSPGLASEAAEHSDLASRFPGARVLGDSGVLNPGELLAYRRMPVDGALGLNAVAAEGFGGGVLTIGDANELDVPAMALAMAGFAGVPLALLAAAGTSVTAGQRARRLAVLRAIGVPARRLRLLLVTESLTICAPGLALGAVFWSVAAGRMTSVPLVGHPVADGALMPRWPLVLGTLAVLVALFAVLAPATERLQGRRDPALPRPRAGRPVFAAIRTVPLLAGLALLLTAVARDGRSAAVTALAGVVVLSAGIPLALPLIARAAGARLAASATLPEQVLSGRRLQYDPRSAVRPLYGVAALLIILPVVASWVSSARELDPPRSADPTVEVVQMRGALGRLDLDGLLRDFPGAVPVIVEETGMGEGLPGQRLGADCGELDRLLEQTVCDPAGALRPEAARRLSRLAFGAPVDGLSPRDLGGLSSSSTLLLFAPRDPSFEPAIRSAALAQPVALTVMSESDQRLHESRLVDWIFGGFTILCLLLFLILAVGVVDRTASGRRGARLLTALGLTPRRVRAVNSREFLLGYLVVVGTGLLGGVLASLSWHSLDPSVPYPLTAVLLLAASAVVLAGIGSLSLRLRIDGGAG